MKVNNDSARPFIKDASYGNKLSNGDNFLQVDSQKDLNLELMANHICQYKPKFNLMNHSASTINSLGELLRSRNNNFEGMSFCHIFGKTTNLMTELYYTHLWVSLSILSSIIEKEEFETYIHNLLQVKLEDIKIPTKDVLSAIFNPRDIYLFSKVNFDILAKQLKTGFSNERLIRSSMDRGIPVHIIFPHRTFGFPKDKNYRNDVLGFNIELDGYFDNFPEVRMYQNINVLFERLESTKFNISKYLDDETIWKGIRTADCSDSKDMIMDICYNTLKFKLDYDLKSSLRERRNVDLKYSSFDHLSTIQRFKRTAGLTFHHFFEKDRNMTNLEFYYSTQLLQKVLKFSFQNIDNDDLFFQEVKTLARKNLHKQLIEDNFRRGLPINHDCELTLNEINDSKLKGLDNFSRWKNELPTSFFEKDIYAKPVITKEKFLKLPDVARIERYFTIIDDNHEQIANEVKIVDDTIQEVLSDIVTTNGDVSFNPYELDPRPLSDGTNCALYNNSSEIDEYDCSIDSNIAVVDSNEFEVSESSSSEEEFQSDSESVIFIIYAGDHERIANEYRETFEVVDNEQVGVENIQVDRTNEFIEVVEPSLQALRNFVAQVDAMGDPFEIDPNFNFTFSSDEEDSKSETTSGLQVAEEDIPNPIPEEVTEVEYGTSSHHNHLSTIWEESEHSGEGMTNLGVTNFVSENQTGVGPLIEVRIGEVNVVEEKLKVEVNNIDDIPRDENCAGEQEAADEFVSVSSIDYAELRAIIAQERNRATLITPSRIEDRPTLNYRDKSSFDNEANFNDSTSIEEARTVVDMVVERTESLLDLEFELENRSIGTEFDFDEILSLYEIEDEEDYVFEPVTLVDTSWKAKMVLVHQYIVGFIVAIFCQKVEPIASTGDLRIVVFKSKELPPKEYVAWIQIGLFGIMMIGTSCLLSMSIMPIMFPPPPPPPPPLKLGQIFALSVFKFIGNIKTSIC